MTAPSDTAGKALEFKDGDDRTWSLWRRHNAGIDNTPERARWLLYPLTPAYLIQALLANPEARMAVLEKMPEYAQLLSDARFLVNWGGEKGAALDRSDFYSVRVTAERIVALSAPTAGSGKDSPASPAAVPAAPAPVHSPSAGDAAGGNPGGETKPWPRSVAERNEADKCSGCKLMWVVTGAPCSPFCAANGYYKTGERESHPDLDAEPAEVSERVTHEAAWGSFCLGEELTFDAVNRLRRYIQQQKTQQEQSDSAHREEVARLTADAHAERVQKDAMRLALEGLTSDVREFRQAASKALAGERATIGHGKWYAGLLNEVYATGALRTELAEAKAERDDARGRLDGIGKLFQEARSKSDSWREQLRAALTSSIALLDAAGPGWVPDAEPSPPQPEAPAEAVLHLEDLCPVLTCDNPRTDTGYCLGHSPAPPKPSADVVTRRRLGQEDPFWAIQEVRENQRQLRDYSQADLLLSNSLCGLRDAVEYLLLRCPEAVATRDERLKREGGGGG